MTKTFESLDVEKRKSIINAALKEFAEKGFADASTNRIVKDAAIGKGMLFYYFHSKKDLYMYLIDYCITIIEKEYFEKVDTTERDLFKRLKDMTKHKMAFLKIYPHAMNFIAVILIQDVANISTNLHARIESIQRKGYEVMYGNVDFSLFRNDLDAEKAITLIQWTFQGYEEALKYRLRHEDIDITTLDYGPYFDEFFSYLEVMKTAFYSKEEGTT